MSEITEQGVAAVDLVGEAVSTRDVQECILAMEQNYGKSYSEELSGRVKLLFAKCLEKDWSSKRFRDAADWIIEHKPFPNWTVADFFTAPMKTLYPRGTWYYKQCDAGVKLKQYKVGEHILYALASDDIPLPEYIAPAPMFVAPEAPQTPPEEHAKVLSGLTGTLAEVAKEIV